MNPTGVPKVDWPGTLEKKQTSVSAGYQVWDIQKEPNWCTCGVPGLGNLKWTQVKNPPGESGWRTMNVSKGYNCSAPGVSSRYIFKPIFHSFWLTHTLVNLPLQGPLRVYLCLACPLPSIAIGLSCTTTLVYQHLSYSPACNSVTMHYIMSSTGLPLLRYITITHLVVT